MTLPYVRSARVRTVALFLLAAAMAVVPAAQQTFGLQDVIPFESVVLRRSLPNGVQLFVRRNERPARRVALRLVVKAGSLHETDDQQGLAHFIEHMAFNGSEHFKPGELVSYFESTGARLGPHVNAYTSFDETVYMLELPTDQPEVVSKGLTALADFAGGLSLLPEEVEKERGVVIEEWRGRLGAGTRVRDKQIPILYFQSRYADRVPIGKPEIIRTAPADRLRAFYDTWYRPELISVIAVGDIDARQIESALSAQFGSLKDRAPAAARPDSSIPLHKELLVSIASDPEISQTSVQIVHKRAKEGERIVDDYRRDVVERLFTQMFNERLADLARRSDARFIGAGVGGGSLGPSLETFATTARAAQGRLVDALTALAVEVRRVRELGFAATELDRAKRSLLAFYERAYNERDKTESGSFAQEYVNYVLVDEPSPGIAYEYRLVQQLLPTITLNDVTALARRRLADDNRVLLAVAPEKADVRLPNETDLRDALTTADMAAVVPWSDSTANRPLMPKVPEPAGIASRRELPDVGVTVVRFSNGLEAWLKPTDFKNDQVLFTMYSRGGTSLAPETDFLNASLAASYVARSGIEGLTAVDLEKMLAGKIASAAPSISLTSHGISGSAAPADLETALQLAHQEFTAPGDDPNAFATLQRQLQAAADSRGQSPGQVFSECLERVNTGNHYTSRPLTPELVDTLDRPKMLSFYRDRFANAADFTFFMVGAIKPDEAIPLLARYLGSLPSTGRRTSDFKDIGLRFPERSERVRCEKGREPRSQTVLSFFADPDPDPIEQERIAAATTILETTLRDVLREELGQTYTVGVGQSQPLPLRGAGDIQISFGAAPENIEAMTMRVLEEVKRLQRDGPSRDLTTRAQESARRNYETNLRQNAYWLRRLEAIHLLQRNPSEIITRPSRIDALTPAALKETFNRYFPMDRYTVVTLVPDPAARP